MKSKPYNDLDKPRIPLNKSQIKILSKPAEFKEEVIKLIRDSKNRIHLSALYIENDETGRIILNELFQAKERNPKLDVLVVVDWHRAQRGRIGDSGIPHKNTVSMYKQIASNYNEQINLICAPVSSKEVFGVLHLKGFVFDNTTLYSGASFNNVYMGHHGKYRLDRYHLVNDKTLADSMVNLIKTISSHSACDNITSIKKLDGNKKRTIKRFRTHLTSLQYTPPKTPVGNNQMSATPIVGISKHNPLSTCIIDLIRNAVSELTIITPYFNLPGKVNQELKKALKRGVQIKLVVGDKTANDFYIHDQAAFSLIGVLPYLYETHLRRFAQKNEQYLATRQLTIHVWRHAKNTFHLKGIWADRQKMLVTGSNLNPRAWRLDLENGILIEDKNGLISDMYDQEMNDLLINTYQVADFRQLDEVGSYPHRIKKIIRRSKRTLVSNIVKKLM